MKFSTTWLAKLKAAELHKIAVAIGTPCSGTKAVQIQGILDALERLPRNDKHDGSLHKNAGRNDLSLISIDMGIRNLAYSHWTAKFNSRPITNHVLFDQPTLQVWRKTNISTSNPAVMDKSGIGLISDTKIDYEADTEAAVSKESFEPIDYADRAHTFIKAILEEHRPTHVVIERQRFRTGGRSAVQEWTIRVGVFEGMLYACLRSLTASSSVYGDVLIEAVLPGRINKYWLRSHPSSDVSSLESLTMKKTAREVKMMKIELVRRLLQAAGEGGQDRMFAINGAAVDVVRAFTEKKMKVGMKNAKPQKPASMDVSKLDDLADCLLQGLAWIHWQNNRFMLDALEHDALPLFTQGIGRS